jgi:hypothetical protein
LYTIQRYDNKKECLPMMRRYHPALPTIAEAAEKPETSGESFLPAPPPAPFLSDHVPIYSAIPLEAGKNDRLFVLSWNVLEADFANGFSAPGRQGVYGENDAAKKDRHQHMANRLSSVLIGGMTDIVALQEITLAKNGLLDEIMKYESTHENYKPLTTRVNGEQAIVNAGNCIILYNHKTIIPLEPAGGTQPGCVIDFIHVSTGKKVKLLNAHLPYSENPAANEAVVKTFLPPKVLTKTRLDAFTKIYTALRDGQTSLLKKNFLLTIGSMTDEAAKASIEANIHRNPNARTALAWKLAETHRTHCNDDNQALLKEIYKLCFEKSNFLSKSSLSGTSLWRSSKVNKTLEEKEITDKDRDHHSRSGKIAAALKPPKK